MRLILLILALVLSASAYAVSTPKYAYTAHPTVFYQTIEEGCRDLDHAYINAQWQIVAFHSMSSDGKVCRYTATLLSSGATHDGVTGNTPILKGYCTSDEPTTVSWPLGPLDESFPNNVNPDLATTPDWPVCADGCSADYESVASCFHDLESSPVFVFCEYNAVQNGAACSTSDAQPTPGTGSCPPGTHIENDRCVADPDDGEPGDGGTDPGDGGTDPGDGGTDPGDGGTDPGDGGTDPGDGGTDPGDGGTDPGDGGTDPGDGGDTGSASGLACGDPFSCSGDALQCALLAEQKRQRCLTESALDFPGQKDHIESFIGDQEGADGLDEGDGDVDVSGLFGEAINTRFLPSACPPPESVSLITAGGRNFEFTYEPLCQLASDFSYLIVLAASIFFAVYVGRSMGGE